MKDTEILTIAIAVTIPFIGVVLGVLINNNRLNDVKELLLAEIKRVEASSNANAELLRREIKAVEASSNAQADLLRAEMNLLRAEMQSFRSELIMLMERHHSEVMLKFADMDARISRIEGERRVVA